ncbi:hypothetical protein [Natrinema pellirubrum]|nr:hypothetical protein [Natrinema pellirubrum]
MAGRSIATGRLEAATRRPEPATLETRRNAPRGIARATSLPPSQQ